MNNKKFVSKTVLFLLLGSLCPAFAQLNGSYPLDLIAVEIPIFNGVPLVETISATSFDITMSQGLTSSKLTGSGEISASHFDVYQDESLVVNFEGPISLSATATKTGNIVRLTGAKATIGKGVVGAGTLTTDEGSFDATVTGVTGMFVFASLSVDLESGEIQGVIRPGSLKVSGYQTDDPSNKATVTTKFSQEEFGPFDFPADNIITPEIELSLTTSSKNKITGSAIGTFGDYDDVNFKVTGTRNAKTGISALTLTSTSVKGVSAKLNLDGNADLNGTKNSMKVLGYTLTY